MPLVEAWHDPHKNKYFPDKSSYRAHLRKVAAERMKKRRFDRHAALLNYRLDVFRFQTENVWDMAVWVRENYVAVLEGMVAQKRAPSFYEARRKTPKIEHVSIDLRYTSALPTRFHGPREKSRKRVKAIPLSYPAFTGRIVVEHNNYFYTEVLEEMGLHIGTGGGGHTLVYDLVVWKDDFPNLVAL